MIEAKYKNPKTFYGTGWTIFMTLMTFLVWPILMYFISRTYLKSVDAAQATSLGGRSYPWGSLKKIVKFEFDGDRSATKLTGYHTYFFENGKIVLKWGFMKNYDEIQKFIDELKMGVPVEYKAISG